MSNTRNIYKDYGSYLRTRGFDKELCKYLNDTVGKYDKTGGLISGNVEINGNLLINNELQFDPITTISKDSNYNMKLFSSGGIILQANNDISMNCNIVNINGNLDMKNNDILNVSSLQLSNSNNSGSFNTTNISSTIQNEQLPSYVVNGISNPLSISRISVFYNNSQYTSIASGITQMVLGTAIVNQMGLTVDSSNIVISASPAISGQFVELYASVNITTPNNNTEFSIDISGVDIGNTFYRNIDNRRVKKRETYNLSFGPLMVLPDEFSSGNQYEFLINNIGDEFTVNYTKIVLKSYFV
jgi:hypothetical protein